MSQNVRLFLIAYSARPSGGTRSKKALVVRNVASPQINYKEMHTMNIAPELMRDKLESAIAEFVEIGWMFAEDPSSDFTRDRKLPLNSLIHLLLKFGGKSLQSEISTYYLSSKEFRQKIPTKSAFTQQRQKLLWEGCQYLLRSFTDSLPYLKLFDGYRLLACDGSTVPLPRNEDEEEYSVVTKEDRRSYNQMHINTLYDILNRLYLDCIIDPGMHINERDAMISMVHRLDNVSKDILLADRGYDGFNDAAHLLENGINFVLRQKDLDSNGIPHALKLPFDGEFDIDVDKTLTFSRSRKYANDDSYVRVNPKRFDLMKNPTDTYHIQFRLVRIKLNDDSYECLVTNLPRDKFPPEKMKKLYHLRWGIENAYRDLKYSVDLLHFHGKSARAVLQELFCSLIMFNFCAYICVHADILHTSKGTKYRYKVNFANAVGPCRAYLHGSIGEEELLDRLRLAPTPIRPNRHSPRSRLKQQPSREFNYRAS